MEYFLAAPEKHYILERKCMNSKHAHLYVLYSYTRDVFNEKVYTFEIPFQIENPT